MGVGIPLGLAIIAVIGFLVWKNRRQRNGFQALRDRYQKRAGNHEHQMYNYPNGYNSQVSDYGPSERLASPKVFEAPSREAHDHVQSELS